MQRLVCVLLLLLTAAPTPGTAGERSGRGEMMEAESLANQALDILPRAKWDVDILREMARNIQNVPEPLAAEILWAAATAPTFIDTTNIFASAIASTSPVVRSVAASILVGSNSPDLKRLLINFVTTERREEIIKHIVQGMASKPRAAAVRSLMDIMFVTNIQGLVLEEATRELRRLTHADISANAGSWRDWWLDNEEKYQD